jgi:hypothetical protein
MLACAVTANPGHHPCKAKLRSGFLHPALFPKRIVFREGLQLPMTEKSNRCGSQHLDCLNILHSVRSILVVVLVAFCNTSANGLQ